MRITNRLLPQAKQMGDTNYRLSNWKPEKKQCRLWQRQAQASLMGQNGVQSGKRQLLKLLTNQPAMQGNVSQHGDPSHESISDKIITAPLLSSPGGSQLTCFCITTQQKLVILIVCISKKKVERLPNLPKIRQK